MYTSVLFVGVSNCSTVQPVVAIERTVFYRERAAGMYSALPYAMAQVKIYFIIKTILISYKVDHDDPVLSRSSQTLLLVFISKVFGSFVLQIPV